MNRLKTIFIAFFIALFIQPAIAEDFKIDIEGAHAFVQFKATHLGFSYVIGRFNDFEGTFSYDESNPEASTINVTIDTASVDSNHAERDKHLRSADFFEVDTYPTITFNSTSFQENGEEFVLTGDLDMHGVKKSVQLAGRHIGHGEDPWGGYRRGFEASVDLDSGEFGFQDWVGTVGIELVIEGVRQ